MKSIVISLKTATQRRQHISHQFENQNIDYSFFDALTPDLALPLSQKMQLNVDDAFLTKGELACFMSHVSVWQKMVDENIAHLAIFEDDVYLGENADYYLNDDSWIDSTWDIIKLEAFADKVFLSAKSSKLPFGNRKIFKLEGKNLGTAGYVLSLAGAQGYLSYIQENQLIPLDQMMFSEYIKIKKMNVYQMSPAVCIQEMMLFPEKKTILSSDLLKERKARMRKYKKRGIEKVHLEIMRIINQIKIKFYGSEVQFK